MSHPSTSANPNNFSNLVETSQSEKALSTSTQRPKRTSAKRSCFNCREKKTRCELPDLYVPSSKEPVIESKRCHRCKVLRIDCVVWDGDRKRKLKLPTQGNSPQPDVSHNKRGRPTLDPQSHLNEAANVMALDSDTSQIMSFPLLPRQYQSNGSSSTPATPSNLERSMGRTHDGSDPRHSSPSIETSTIQPEDCIHLEDGKEKIEAMLTRYKTTRSAWRILSLLVDYSSQQPQFYRYLLHRVSSPQRPIRSIDIMDIIDRNECLELSSCMMPYFVWHPHLPTLVSLYDLNNRHTDRSSSFLLATMYLIASRHRHSLSTPMMRCLSATVDRLGTQLIFSSTRDIKIVQALDLLIAHEPSLIGTCASGDESEQMYRGSGLAGEKLLKSAISIAKDLGLDRSIYALHELLEMQNRGSLIGRAQIQDAINASSLWISLRIWESYHIFFKPMNRVLRDLGALADASTCLIAIDSLGNKINNGQFEPHGSNAGPMQWDVTKEAEYLRSAGRTILVHRMQAVAQIHECICEITDLLSSPEDINKFLQTNEINLPSHQTPVLPEIKDKIVSTVLSVFEKRPKISQRLHMEMAPFTSLNSVQLAEEWTELEWNTLLATLSTLGISCLHAGKPDAGFTIRSFFEALSSDEKLQECVSKLGKNKLELSERLVSSFAFFNRRPTPTSDNSDSRNDRNCLIELTGAPIFLTCAFVLDSCRLFLEGTAFVLVTYQVIQINFDSRLLSMIQAAQRLDEFDKNRYIQEDHPQSSSQDKPPLSIPQLSAKFIREMIETLERWRLGSSIYRKPLLSPPYFRSKLSKSQPSSVEDQSTKANETQDESANDAGTPRSINYSTSSETDHDSSLTPLQRDSSTPFPSTPNSNSATYGQSGTQIFASGSNNHPVLVSQYGVQQQEGHGYSNEFWQFDPYSRGQGSIDHILLPSFSESTSNSGDLNSHTLDMSFIGNFLDTLF